MRGSFFGGVVLSALVGAAGCASSPNQRTGDRGDAGMPSGATGGATSADAGRSSGGGGTSNADAGDAGALGDVQDATPVLDSSSDGDAGDFAGLVLRDPQVTAALQAAADAGHPLFVHTERQPPPISGYYLKPENEGSFVATGNGDGVGNGVFGFESRVTVDASDLVTQASVSFSQGYIIGGSTETGMVLRGTGDEITLYTTYHGVCPVQGSDFAVDGYSITSARVVADTGYWLFVRRLIVTTATHGTLTPDCAQTFVGNSETVGGWGESEVPRYQRIQVSDLQYMCVDGDVGYVENETWNREGGTCTCTVNYQVECG